MNTLLTSVFLLSCGSNALEVPGKIPPGEQASKLLEKNESQAAIKILLKALGSEFKNTYALAQLTDVNGQYTYSTAEFSFLLKEKVAALKASGTKDVPALISVLSAAHSQKYGIDPFDIALAMASGSDSDSDSADSSSSGGEAPVTALYDVLPAATKENKRGLNEAIAILNAIDPADLSPADYFKQSLLLVSNISLITKTLDTSPVDGSITPNELANLEEGDAYALLELVALAALAVVSSGEVDGVDSETAGAKSAETVVKMKEQLDSIEGEDDPEKAKEFIKKITAKDQPQT